MQAFEPREELGPWVEGGGVDDADEFEVALLQDRAAVGRGPGAVLAAVGHATALAAVEKAIMAANLGMNPSNDGKIIRLTVPALNEERRKQFAKQVHEIAEEHRIAVRNVRHHSNDLVKKLLKDKAISEDDERSGLDDVQKLTNTYISKIDELSKNKEAEIMSV